MASATSPPPSRQISPFASKDADHLPLHRLERIMSRHGVELSRKSDAVRSATAMAYIRQLYAIEKATRELITARKLDGAAADEIFYTPRQAKSLTVLSALKSWLEAEQPKVLPKSLIGLAIAYTLRHWEALARYTSDGFVDIDNNSADGARTAATLFTITSSCHRHGIDVFAYLHDMLQRLAHEPKPPPEQLRDWLPDRWQPPPPTRS